MLALPVVPGARNTQPSTRPGTPSSKRVRVLKSVLQERQAQQLQPGWDRGLDRDGPGLGL
jgi:hypothetical protein